MASIKDIPFTQFKNVADGFKANEAARRSCVRIAVVLDGEVDKTLATTIKGALMPKTATGLINVSRLGAGDTLRINPDCDLAIILSGSAGQAVAAARSYAGCKVPCAIVVESSVEVVVDELPQGVELICAAGPATLLAKLGSWMVRSCSADLALATNFDFIRAQVSDSVISERAAQNAIIGVLPFGNSADMPVMAANQFLMSLDLGSAHGRGGTTERAATGAGIVASSFASRALARSLMKKLPGLGWVVRGAVGYAATWGIGKALTTSYVVQDAWKRRQ